MNPRGKYPESSSDLAENRLAWLLALVAAGLVLLAAALALDLHNQKRRLENIGARLKQTQVIREADTRMLEASLKTGESAHNRLVDGYVEGGADLKKFGEAYTQREPVVKQATEVQNKTPGRGQ